MDAVLRNVLRDYKRGERTREEALVALARADISPESLARRTEGGPRFALVEQLDYAKGFEFIQPHDGTNERLAGCAIFRALSGSHAVVVIAWPPSIEDILEGHDEDVRLVVYAPLKDRLEVLETIEETFPGTVVLSAQVAGGKRPPRIPTKVEAEALWPEESKRVHVR